MSFEYCGRKNMGLDIGDTKPREVIVDTIPTLKESAFTCPLNRKARRNFQNKKTICYYCMSEKNTQ